MSGQRPRSSSDNGTIQHRRTSSDGRTATPAVTPATGNASNAAAGYAARVYSAANAAAQPLLGYLGGATPPSAAAGPRSSRQEDYAGPPSQRRPSISSSNVQRSMQPTPSSGSGPSTRAPTPSTTTVPVPGMRRAASTSQPVSSQQDEEARRKDSRNLDSIISQFYAKAAQVITQARFTHVQSSSADTRQREGSLSRGGSSSNLRGSAASSTSKRTRNRWFNIEMEESDVFREELRTWRSVTSLLQQQYQPVDPESASSSLSGSTSGSRIPLSAYSAIPTMVIEVILDVSDMSSNQVLVLNNALSSKDGSTRRFRVDLSGKGKGTNLHDVAPDVLGGTSPKKCNIVLERWTLSLRPPPPPTSPELPGVYKHCIILFRALYTLVRALPSYELHRKQKRRTGRSELKIGCRLSAKDSDSPTPVSESLAGQQEGADKHEISLEETLGDDEQSFSVQDFAFAPVVTPLGTLDLRCKYRACVDFSVEEMEALLSSRFIDEDFFKPTMRKYSSSSGQVGSLPIRGSAPAAGAADRPRSTYGSLASRHPPPTSRSPVAGGDSNLNPLGSGGRGGLETDEGAFVTYGRASGAQALSRTNSLQGQTAAAATDIQRRPSIGGSHPFKPSSSPGGVGVGGGGSGVPMRPSSAASGTSEGGAAPPDRQLSLHERYSSSYRMSSSPASLSGPSSSLRYAYQEVRGSPDSGSATPAGNTMTSSQISYTKRAVPSTSSGQPPISGLSALQIGSSSPQAPMYRPASATSAMGQASAPDSPHMRSTGTQPVPVPGTPAGIPLSSSPTPSLLKRYSSSRYSRSFGQTSTGSSPGAAAGIEGGAFWSGAGAPISGQPESLGRRSRLSSETTRSRDDLPNAATGAPASRQRPVSFGRMPDASASKAEDADDIQSFLGLIDSRAQLARSEHPGSSSRLLARPSMPPRPDPASGTTANAATASDAGGSTATSSRSPVTSGRARIEERLKSLAESVYRGEPEPPQAARVASYGPSVPSGSMSIPTRSIGISTGSQQQHVRSRSGDHSPYTPSSRQSPSPDLQAQQGYTYSVSPAEQAYLSTSAGTGTTTSSLRIRASQPPMSSSIPEEDASHSQHHQTYAQYPHREGGSNRHMTVTSTSGDPGTNLHVAGGAIAPGPPELSSTSVSTGSSPASHHQFPFPRYVPSSAMRKRRSSQGSASAAVGSGSRLPTGLSPAGSSSGNSPSSTSGVHMPSARSGLAPPPSTVAQPSSHHQHLNQDQASTITKYARSPAIDIPRSYRASSGGGDGLGSYNNDNITGRDIGARGDTTSSAAEDSASASTMSGIGLSTSIETPAGAASDSSSAEDEVMGQLDLGGPTSDA